MPSRITITMRHTGRFYVSLSMEDFFTLYGFVLMSEAVEWITMARTPKDLASRKRVVAAFKASVAKAKADAEKLTHNA